MPTKMRRQPGEGTIHKRPNGTWCGQLNLGIGRDGERRRKTVYGRSQADVVNKMDELRRQLAAHGDLATADTPLSKWLELWLTDIAARRVKPGTWRSYRTAVNEHIVPAIGKIRLGRLSAQHIRRMHSYIVDEKRLSPTTAHNAHRVLSAALNDAMREGRVGRNMAAIIKAPAKADSDRLGLSAPAAKAVLSAAQGPLRSRWLLALLLGLRQGERLGLRWSHVDFDNRLIDLSWSLSHVSWAHGCDDGKCGKTARSCKQRRLPIPAGMRHVELGGNLVLMTPKTKGSVRVVPMIPPVEAALRERLAIVQTETHDPDHDLVWCRPDGSPIDPRSDWADWNALLAAAKVPKVTLHEARHTTATLLLEAGVDAKVVGSILGHSVITTTRGYQHVSTALARQALEAAAAKLELT